MGPFLYQAGDALNHLLKFGSLGQRETRNSLRNGVWCCSPAWKHIPVMMFSHSGRGWHGGKVAKQSLRTTALSCLRKRETNVHTQDLKTENPKRAHCSFLIQAERKHKPSYLWFRGIKFKGWALCVLFCFSLFFFFPAIFFLKCHSVSEVDFFGLLVGWMDWVIAQYLAYFAQAELCCYREDIDKLKGVPKRALQQVRVQSDWITRKVAES